MITKRTLASRMLTSSERKAHTPVFLSRAWLHRKAAIAKRVEKVENRAKLKKLAARPRMSIINKLFKSHGNSNSSWGGSGSVDR